MELPISFSKKVLSIDFGSKEIKVIEGKCAKSNINISNYFTLDLPRDAYYDGEILDKSIIITELKEAIKKNKIKTETVYGVINSSSIITREVSIPKVPEKEVSSIIQYQLNEFLPVDPEDYVVDYMILREAMEDEIGRLNILLVAVPKTMVLAHLELIKDIGLKAEVLDFQGNSMAKLIGFNNQINGFYNIRDLAIASIDIGYSGTKLTITRNGKVEVSRVVDIGTKTLFDNLASFFDYSWEEREEKTMSIVDINSLGDEFTDDNRFINIVKLTIENIIEKVETVFRYYMTRETGNEVSYIVLNGGLTNIKGLDNLFSNHFGIPSMQLETLDKIKLNKELNKYSNAIGGLIRINEVKK